MSSTPSRQYIDKNGKTGAQTYFEDCLDGKIVVGRYVRMLAEKMLREMDDGYKRWHYDPEYAIRPVRFIERFCRHTSGSKGGKPFILEPYELAVIETAYGFVDDDGYRRFREVLIEWARKCGKGLSLSEELPTPSGWRTMGDLHVGDVVFGQDGKPSTIIAESEIFDKPTYVVTFEDGAKIKATDDHIWTVRNPGGEWFDTTTEKLAGYVSDSGWLELGIEVPLCAPVEYPRKDLPDDPYEVGIRCATSEKNVPEEYLTASIQQRRDLFKALMSVLGKRKWATDTYVEVVTKNSVLMAQTKELASSLGVSWSLSDGCPESMEVYTPGDTGKLISYIERIPNEPTKCIAIDNPSHLYLVGRQYTATHNTEVLAGLNIYMLTSDGEYGAQCYNGATTKAQASLCYGKTKKMIEKSPMLAKRVRSGHIDERDTTGLIYDKTSSYLCTISSRADALDGLDMHFGVLDELAATRDNGSVYGLLKGSMGSRKQPMLFMISSNGHVRDNIFDDRRNYGVRWLKGDIEDDRFLAFLYEMDSREEVNQRDMWPKASPGLGTVKSWDYMDDMVQQMRQNPRDAGEILAKQFNLPENEASSFLTYNECHNPATFEFDPKTDRYGVVGFDLAKSGDLNAAVCMYMRPGDEHIYELSMAWIAEEQVKINSNMLKERDGVPYHLWANNDYIRIVPGDKVNQRVVMDWIRELAGMGIMIRYVGYDDWHVDDWTQRELAQMVGEENFEAVPQYAKTLSPAMVEHQLDLRAKRIVSNNNPIIEWCRSNVQTKAQDANGNYFPQKKGLRANRRIDMYMAELFAYIELKKHWDEYLQTIGWDRAQ